MFEFGWRSVLRSVDNLRRSSWVAYLFNRCTAANASFLGGLSLVNITQALKEKKKKKQKKEKIDPLFHDFQISVGVDEDKHLFIHVPYILLINFHLFSEVFIFPWICMVFVFSSQIIMNPEV